MDAREKNFDLKHGIAQIIMDDAGGWLNVYISVDAILDLPELEAYFREKFENEPSRLVSEKECHSKQTLCPDCRGTGTIKRRMTRKEVEEWAYKIALYHGQMHYCMPLDGERVIVEE